MRLLFARVGIPYSRQRADTRAPGFIARSTNSIFWLIARCSFQGIRGPAVTPFVLAWLHRESGGRTLAANRDLIVGNARLAGEIAAAA